MLSFHYKAMDAAGRVRTGALSAPSLEELELRLAAMELDLIAGRPATRSTLARAPASRRDLIHFCFQLEQLLAAGVPLMQALVDLRDSLENRDFRAVVSTLVEHIGQGASFSAALAECGGTFDALFVNLVRAGEQSGRLPEVLRDLAESLKWQDEVAARARQVLTYPAFTGVVIGGVVLFLMVYLVPQLARFITDMQGTLPLHTRALLAASGFLSRWWWLLLFLPTVLVGALVIAARRDEVLALRLDEFRLRLWGIGEILRKLALARVARLFALMYRAGIPVLEILRVVGDAAGNRALGHAIADARERVSAGHTITRALEHSGLFPPLVLRMIATGETTGALDTALENVAYFFERDVRARIDRLEAMVGPVLTIVLGLVLGWIMLAVLGPIYDLLGRIGR